MRKTGEMRKIIARKMIVVRMKTRNQIMNNKTISLTLGNRTVNVLDGMGHRGRC